MYLYVYICIYAYCTATQSKNKRAQLFLQLNEEIYVTRLIFFALISYVAALGGYLGQEISRCLWLRIHRRIER